DSARSGEGKIQRGAERGHIHGDVERELHAADRPGDGPCGSARDDAWAAKGELEGILVVHVAGHAVEILVKRVPGQIADVRTEHHRVCADGALRGEEDVESRVA